MKHHRPHLSLACLALAAAVLLAAPSHAKACPNCRDIVADSSPAAGGAAPAGLARGFNYSIYLMMAAPFVLMGSFGAGIWYVASHNPARPAAVNPDPDAPSGTNPPA